MPKSEERRSNTIISSSSSPRFFSWKCRNNSTKRHQQQVREQQHPPISVSSPSSPLMMEKEQISSCSSPQLVRLSTTKPMNMDEHQTLVPIKNGIKKIDEIENESDSDEHAQIAFYARRLASINDKQKQNLTGIQPPIRISSCPMNLQMNNHLYSRTMTTTVPMPSIRSINVDHQSAEKRLIISKLEAKNR